MFRGCAKSDDGARVSAVLAMRHTCASTADADTNDTDDDEGSDGRV